MTGASKEENKTATTAGCAHWALSVATPQPPAEFAGKDKECINNNVIQHQYIELCRQTSCYYFVGTRYVVSVTEIRINQKTEGTESLYWQWQAQAGKAINPPCMPRKHKETHRPTFYSFVYSIVLLVSFHYYFSSVPPFLPS